VRAPPAPDTRKRGADAGRNRTYLACPGPLAKPLQLVDDLDVDLDAVDAALGRHGRRT
jgi:hypothetical protein